jgi:hypothetical protein
MKSCMGSSSCLLSREMSLVESHGQWLCREIQRDIRRFCYSVSSFLLVSHLGCDVASSLVQRTRIRIAR